MDLMGYSTARCPHRSAANLRAGSGSQSRRQYWMVGGTRSSAPSATRSPSPPTSSVTVTRSSRAVVKYKAPGGRRWLKSELHAVDAHISGVRWAGEFAVETPGSWQYTFEAWTDRWATYHDELRRKVEANLDEDLSGEVSEGLVLLEKALERAKGESEGVDRIRPRRPRASDAPMAREVHVGARPGAVRSRWRRRPSARARPRSRSR